MFTHVMERTPDALDQSRQTLPSPAVAGPDGAEAAHEPVVALAVMSHHPRTPDSFWEAIGWQAQADAFAPVRLKRQKQAEAEERRAAAAEHSVIGRGERLGLIRAQAGLNARQLSRIVGVLPSDVTEWERNLRPIPFSMVPAIERACKDTLIPTWTAA